MSRSPTRRSSLSRWRCRGSGRDQSLVFRTNVDDIVTAGPEHPIRFAVEPGSQGLKPYLLVRGRLEALVTRALYYDLVEMAVDRGPERRRFACSQRRYCRAVERRRQFFADAGRSPTHTARGNKLARSALRGGCSRTRRF